MTIVRAYMRSDIAAAGLAIPDMRQDHVYYAEDDVAGSRVVTLADDGITTLELSDGSFIQVDSIDLEFVTVD